MSASIGRGWSRRERTTARGTHLPAGDTLARPRASGALSVPFGREPGDGTGADDRPVVAAAVLSPVQPGISTSTRAEVLGGAASVEAQLRRLELRLLAEAGGDPAVESAVRRHLADSCMRFATARVRLFVPILVEREVRRRLRDEDWPA